MNKLIKQRVSRMAASEMIVTFQNSKEKIKMSKNIYIDKIEEKLEELIQNPAHTYSEETLKKRLANNQDLIVDKHLTFIGVSLNDAHYEHIKNEILNCVKRTIDDFVRMNTLGEDKNLSSEAIREVNTTLRILADEFKTKEI